MDPATAKHLADEIAFLLFVLISVGFVTVLMLLQHQRRTAELIHKQIEDQDQSNMGKRLEAIEGQLQDLRALMHSQIIQQDAAQPLPPSTAVENLQHRVSQK
ncbi:MAG: hypothetical protein JSS72_00255 [Armatimonadetes bacterium]|nr:hypothetical protein [Armatimonadota bacterium]